MIKRWSIGREVEEDAREQFINAKRQEIAAALLINSDLKTRDRVIIAIDVRKVRNRKKDATTDEYIISGTLTI